MSPCSRQVSQPPHIHWPKEKETISSFERSNWHAIIFLDGPASFLVGREVLIKAITQAVPTYAMSVFKLPKDLCSSIQSLINNFWWGNNKGGWPIHWIRMEKLQNRKVDGGLGFRDMESFNDTLLAKRFWQLLKSPNSLVTHILQAKYYLNCSILNADLGHRLFTWCSILCVRDLVSTGACWFIGNEHSISVWSDHGSQDLLV